MEIINQIKKTYGKNIFEDWIQRSEVIFFTQMGEGLGSRKRIRHETYMLVHSIYKEAFSYALYHYQDKAMNDKG
jgi:hypothetical protein